jgi:NADPH:quinone reductase-like Zn-dependent oxidoreductase
MKAILLRRTGDPSVLEYVEVSTPRPGEGDVLVRADTIGVSMPEGGLCLDAAVAGDPRHRDERHHR